MNKIQPMDAQVFHVNLESTVYTLILNNWTYSHLSGPSCINFYFIKFYRKDRLEFQQIEIEIHLTYFSSIRFFVWGGGGEGKGKYFCIEARSYFQRGWLYFLFILVFWNNRYVRPEGLKAKEQSNRLI